ncbi:MAG: glycosyltransferase family A protein, partial [Litorimonas sp.]
DNTPQAIKALARQDARIIPILLKDNGGTYVAKNHGRAIAKWEFITCQDSDDWAHPQKLASLLEVLLEDENLIGAECGHVRISKAQGIQRRVQGYLKPDASSFMYRREIVDNSVGFYDSVRAGADGEFKLRLIRYFGANAFKFHKALLSIVEWAEGTLSGSGSEYAISSFGVFSPARLEYRQRFNASHEYGLFEQGRSALYRPQNPEKNV